MAARPDGKAAKMAKLTVSTNTETLEIPTSIQGDIVKKMQERSVIANLCASTPQIFTNAEYIVFSEEPEAEYVSEGAAKSSASWGITPVVAKPHKIQTTIRLNEEVQWADDDNKLQVLDAVFDSMTNSLSRAIDYGMIHGINPLTKAYVDALKTDSLVTVANQVTATGEIQADLDSIADSVIDNYDVTGIALDRTYASAIRKLRNTDGVRLYPEVGLDLNPANLDGLRCVTSGAVAGKRLAPEETGIQAIVGDWSKIKWGMIRNFSLEQINYGDPDGLGDLKRYNQVAYRVEGVFSWANLAPDAFAVLKAAAAAKSSSK